MPYTHNAPFRYDVVGSFLRPDVLKQARADHAADVIDDAALKAVTDGGAKLAVGTYTGTGNSNDTTVTVGFPVKALILATGNTLDGHNGLFVTSGQTVSGGITGQVLWFTDTGFRVKTAMYSGEVCPPYLNTAAPHYYVAIG